MLRYFTYSDENRAFYGFRSMNERVFPQPAKDPSNFAVWTSMAPSHFSPLRFLVFLFAFSHVLLIS